MAGRTGGINKAQLSANQAAPQGASRRWHAVAIKPQGQCCDAVQNCRTRRFLSKDAPRLPLAECSTSGTCACVYKHHADRRAPPRRQEERDGLPRGKVELERRLSRDRRKID